MVVWQEILLVTVFPLPFLRQSWPHFLPKIFEHSTKIESPRYNFEYSYYYKVEAREVESSEHEAIREEQGKAL